MMLRVERGMNMSALDLALLIVRVVLGITLIVHDSQKTFGWFGGSGLGGLVRMMTNQGSATPKLLAWIAALSEFGGGLFVLIGLLTPLAAALIVSTMLVAIVTSHFKNGFLNSNKGFEFNLSLIALALVLVLLGAGSISIDGLLGIAEPINFFPVWAIILLVLVIFAGLVSTELSKSLGGQKR